MPEHGSSNAPAATPGSGVAVADGRQQVVTNDAPDATIAHSARRIGRLLTAVIAPATLVTALAYYFGWRREQTFAGYFGIDPALLGLTTSDYVLRSVDALFVPMAAVLLAAFAVLALQVLVAGRIRPRVVAPAAGVIGIVALGIGLALAIGHPLSSRFIYLQALGLGLGVVLLVYALARWRGAQTGSARGVQAALSYVGVAVAIVSVFWATAEYADSRGLSLARKLAADININPRAIIYSKVDLNIDPLGEGSGANGTCAVIDVRKSPASTYRFRYTGFTLLARSNGKYFLTPTPADGPWDPSHEAVFVLPDDGSMRVELMRGRTYRAETIESTFAGPQQLPFTC